ncbi:MAG TPA: hypothetical protein VF545_06580 [Thermoleophilaceae bacterium]|jgi:hypothetical protein
MGAGYFAVLAAMHHVAMSTRQLTHVATDTARSIRRRLAAAAAPRVVVIDAPADPEAEQRAGEADLDSLRGELVRELDRLAVADADCSASFRRVG